MTNLKTKKSHFAKSKILLIVLCIFGLAFSYSCSCRDDNPYQPEIPPPTKIDPTFFTITTNIVETRLVQKASDKSLAYQPSIKFSEANTNGYTLTYSTDNATFKDKLKYDEKTGLITLTDYNDLQESKITIQITFVLKATNEALSNNTTNFTLSVDLKKTKGNLPTSAAKTLIQRLAILQFVGGGFVNFSDPDATVTDEYFMGKVSAPDGKDTFEYSKSTYKQKIIDETKKQNDKAAADKKIPYGKAEYTQDKDGGSGKWMFELKFTFNDTDYDLTDDQKNNGMKYQIYIDRVETVNQDGSKSYVLNWID